MSLAECASDFARIVTALVIVLDPLALMPLIVGLDSRMDAHESRALRLRVVGGATVLLLFFTVTGTWVLRLFVVTLDDLRIGGGLLLLIIALRMVIEGRLGSSTEEEYHAAIVPLISPLLVGPGAITAAVVFATLHGVLITAAAGIVSMVICLLLFMSAGIVNRLIGQSGANLVTRIMGMLIATIAISYIRTGITHILHAHM